MHLRTFHNLLQGILVPELAVGVVHTVAVILLSNFAEVLQRGAVFAHVLTACVRKHCWRKRTLIRTVELNCLVNKVLKRVSSVLEEAL
jgi:hypothetical protein